MVESSPEEFTRRFAAYAAEGTLYPQPEGSGLLEFAAAGRVLYLLDRSGPYAARPGPARVLVSAALKSWEAVEPAEESLSLTGVSALEGRGELVEAGGGALVLRARLPLVLLGDPAPRPQPGQWLHFTTEAPLHGFLL